MGKILAQFKPNFYFTANRNAGSYPRKILASPNAIRKMKELELNIEDFVDRIKTTMLLFEFRNAYVSISYGELVVAYNRFSSVKDEELESKKE